MPPPRPPRARQGRPALLVRPRGRYRAFDLFEPKMRVVIGACERGPGIDHLRIKLDCSFALMGIWSIYKRRVLLPT